jgi:hypothetical protein
MLDYFENNIINRGGGVVEVGVNVCEIEVCLGKEYFYDIKNMNHIKFLHPRELILNCDAYFALHGTLQCVETFLIINLDIEK